MSGLAKFISTFLASPNGNGTVDGDANDQQGNDGPRGNTNGQVIHAADNYHDGAMAAGQPTVDYCDSLSSVLANRQPFPSSPSQQTVSEGNLTWTFHEWRDYRNGLLTDFVHRRLYREEEEDDDDDDGDDNDETKEGEEKDETNQVQDVVDEDVMDDAPDTQQVTQNDGTANKEGSKDNPPIDGPRRRKRTRIPHCDDAVHDVNTVSAIDLYSNTVNLSLCKVEMVFPLRESKRLAKMEGRHVPPNSRDVASPDQHMDDSDRIYESLRDIPPFLPDLDDDGPLATIHKSVLSMEVVQLMDPVATETANKAAAVCSNRPPKRRIRVFFYNKYALTAHHFLETTSTSTVLMSLRDIPTICIFPYRPIRTTSGTGVSWHDQDMADYCICLGDKSSMKMQKSIENSTSSGRLHFDSHQSMVVLAKQKPQLSPKAASKSATPDGDKVQEFEETVLSHTTLISRGNITMSTDPILEARYLGWKAAYARKAVQLPDVSQSQGLPTKEQTPAKAKATRTVLPRTDTIESTNTANGSTNSFHTAATTIPESMRGSFVSAANRSVSRESTESIIELSTGQEGSKRGSGALSNPSNDDAENGRLAKKTKLGTMNYTKLVSVSLADEARFVPNKPSLFSSFSHPLHILISFLFLHRVN